MNVSLGSTMLTIPPGSTTSTAISVSSAGTAGSATITASASGFPGCAMPFANANLAVDVLAPGFSWAAPPPQPQTVAWGNSASYSLSVVGQNLDSATIGVNLAASGLPVGASANVLGSPVTLSPGSLNGSATLTLNTTLSGDQARHDELHGNRHQPGTTSTAKFHIDCAPSARAVHLGQQLDDC